MAKALILRDVPAYDLTWVIGSVVKNPKRPDTACWYRFAGFESGMTVAEYASFCGKGFRSEIAWCAARGYIELVNPAEIFEPSVDEVDAE